ncbi:putative lactoylglutathione lyase [Flavobacterium nitrogenifigens]|uniref:Lactoylglutathione lyase n=2 Tax=Flavobacterium TaxID=237 RepID=A0ABR6QI61_9FLAO|nr:MULTISPECIES: VOC family protein [Flavobacterium]MBB4803949.1 putative lactoylglutathione lyase [Flavobacterium nitrogenifigens]MBB6388899.1 putative lactoylglutathione lyase [Flavobacterium notoginsengisoli]
METKMIWGNLVSNDLQKTIKFYNDLGFKQNGKETDELVSFIFAENSFIINFFVPERLEIAVKGKLANAKSQSEIIFSLSAKSREEVDLWYEKVKQIGGTIFSEPENFEVGYTFGFADPDGHKFNFLYWPGM